MRRPGRRPDLPLRHRASDRVRAANAGRNVERVAAHLLILVLSSSLAVSGEEEARALIAKARPVAARGGGRALTRLVETDRVNAYEAVDRLLNDGDLPLAAALAAAYERAFGDRGPAERIETFSAWGPEERARRAEAIRLKGASKQAFAEGRFVEAKEGYEKALETFRKIGDLREQGRCLSNLGAVADLQGQGSLALELLNEAREIASRAGDRDLIPAIEINRAYALDESGDVEGARSALESAIRNAREIGDRQAEARGLLTLGTILFKTSRVSEAVAVYHDAVRVARLIGDVELESTAWFNLSAQARHAGDIDEEERALRRSLEASRRGGFLPAQVEATVGLVSIARRRGDAARARTLLDDSRALAATTEDEILKANVEHEDAVQRMSEGRYSEAIAILDAAESRVAGLEAPGKVAALRGARAAALYHLGEYDEAVAQVRLAQEEAAAGARPDLEASLHADLGHLLSILGDSVGGLAELEKAARIHGELEDEVGLATDLDAIGSLRLVAGDLAGARDALLASLARLPPGQGGTDRPEVLKDLAMVEMAAGAERLEVARSLLTQAVEEFSAASDFDGIVHSNLLLADLALSSGGLAGARDALGRIPRGRETAAHAWQLRYMEGRIAEAVGDVPAAIRSYRKSVEEVERLRNAVRPEPGKAAIMDDRIAPYRALVRILRGHGDVEGSYAAARAMKARTFVESLNPPGYGPEGALDDPGSGALLPVPAVPADRIRSDLSEGEILIDFFLDGEELGAFVVTRTAVAWRPIPAPTGALRSLAEASRYPGRPGPGDSQVTDAWRAACARLGAMILDPFERDLRGIDHLFLVPTGPLNGVPFAGLRVGGRLLVERFSASVLPAAEALLGRERAGAPRAGSTLAIGDPAVPGGEARLPASADEARAVASLARGLGEVVIGASATEAGFKKLAPRFDRVHIATHGRTDPLTPVRSYLELARGGTDDGRLEAGEIASMRIQASLVVLSGCRTGVETGIARGESPGDERFGIARAFLGAGAKEVVAGLWEADDEASRAFMPLLHAGLGGRSAAEALAVLQRDLIRGRIRDGLGRVLDHPFYWAGLAAFGSGVRGGVAVADSMGVR